MPQALPSESTTAGPFGPPTPFACGWKLDGFGSARVHLSGELDLSTLPSFQEALREAQSNAGAVSIDLQELEFIDAASLGAIASAHAVAQRRGHKLVLVRGSGQVDRVVVLAGLHERVDLVDPRY